MTRAPIVHPLLAQASFERAIRPLLDQPEVYGRAGITLHALSYPFLDLRLEWYRQGISLNLRVDATDYSYRPIGGWWISDHGDPLRQETGLVPSGMGFHPSGEEGKPWFCFLGWREYHDHPGHQGVSWAALRSQPRYGVLQLIQQLQKDLNGQQVTRS